MPGHKVTLPQLLVIRDQRRVCSFPPRNISETHVSSPLRAFDLVQEVLPVQRVALCRAEAGVADDAA